MAELVGHVTSAQKMYSQVLILMSGERLVYSEHQVAYAAAPYWVRHGEPSCLGACEHPRRVHSLYHSPRSNADAGWQSGERSYSLVREVTHTLAGTPSVDVDSTAHVCV